MVIKQNTLEKGSIGNFFVYAVLAILIILGITIVNGLPKLSTPQGGEEVTIITPTPGARHSTLQLQNFGYITNTPPPSK